MAGDDDDKNDLDGLLTEHDHRLADKADEIIARAMREAPSWLTQTQRERIRESLEVDLLVDPRGRAWLQHLLGGPAEVEDSAQMKKWTAELQEKIRQLGEDDEADAG